MGKGKPSKTPWPPPQRHQITTCSMSPPSARPPVFHQPVTYKVTPDRSADKDTSGKPWRTTRELMRLSTPMTPLLQTLAASTPHYLVMHTHRHTTGVHSHTQPLTHRHVHIHTADVHSHIQPNTCTLTDTPQLCTHTHAITHTLQICTHTHYHTDMCTHSQTPTDSHAHLMSLVGTHLIQ